MRHIKQTKSSTYSIEQTRELAQEIAKSLKHGDIVALNGELGAGKSTFSKFIIEYLGFSYLGSPTFSKIITYRNEKNQLWHVDLYQANSAILDEYIYDLDNGILLVEWAKNYNNLHLFSNVIEIHISHSSDNIRKIEISRKI